MEKVLIKVENVSKKFSKDFKKSLYYGMLDVFSKIVGSKKKRELRGDEFWAVRNVSFELKRGECLALIGHNGAGKSTLLKILNGLIAPDEGKITIYGKVGALIELGAGFNPILTGRENIYNNAAVIGFTKQEIDAKFDSIVEFSEIGDFIDMPVQNYSSGMKVRLGFAIATQMEPDVLILDEILAVGDAGFKIKSFNKISEIIRNTAVIFVSHSMPTIMRICNQAVFLVKGKVDYLGNNVNTAIERYYKSFASEKSFIEFNNGAEIEELKLNGNSIADDESIEVKYLDTLTIDLKIKLKKPVESYYLTIGIVDKDLKLVGAFFGNKFHESILPNDENRVRIEFPEMQFVDGDYTITYYISENIKSTYSYLAIYRNYTKLRMYGLEDSFHASIYMKGNVFANGKESLKMIQ